MQYHATSLLRTQQTEGPRRQSSRLRGAPAPEPLDSEGSAPARARRASGRAASSADEQFASSTDPAVVESDRQLAME